MKKLIILVLINTGLVVCVNAQTAKPVYRQFFFNPYQQNAGFVGMNSSTELNMFYKKQWVGIAGAPTTAGVSLQIPTGDRVKIGLKIASDNQVILKNNSVSGTFGYAIPLGKDEELRFGLSAGMDVNRFDFTADELNTSDPAILRAAGNNYNINGDFGVVYKYAGLRVGFALTELFGSDPFNEESYNKFSKPTLENRLYSLSYRFNLDRFQNLALEPFVLYNQTTDNRNNYWDVATLFYYQNKVWSGASYNNRSGAALHFGMDLLNRFKFSYSYEFPSPNIGSAVKSSHELHLQMSIGKKPETFQE